MSDDKRPDIDYQTPYLDFPDGSGDPKCTKCRGRGVVPMMVDIGGGQKWPGGGTKNCACVFKRDLIANVKRIWPVLLNTSSVEKSPLINLTKQNLWITASGYDFRRHLRFVAFRMGTSWDARVISDAKLITSWLSTAKFVHDGDVNKERRDTPSNEFFTIEDIAVPFKLLIIKLGVKAAANKEMPNVLMEAINEREQKGKPTWVVDSHAIPLAMTKCYSEGVVDLLDGFRRVIINEGDHAATTLTVGASGEVTEVAAPVAGTGMAASIYTRRKAGMAPTPIPGANVSLERSAAEQEAHDDGLDEPAVPRAPIVVADDDEFSVDTLMAESEEVAIEATGAINPVADESFDVDEAIANFPSNEDLGTSAVPDYMKRGKVVGKAKRALSLPTSSEGGDE